MTRRAGASGRVPVVRIPVTRLPDNARERDEILQDYVAERVPEAVRSGDVWKVQLLPPPWADYYIDPRLHDGLAWWSKFAVPILIEDIPFAVRRRPGAQVSLSDAWTIASWSRLLTARDDAAQPAPLVVLHVDDHDDLMSPRLVSRYGTLVDLVTGKPVDLYRPSTVTAALNSGAIGMGSFIVPALAAGRQIHIRHLRRPTRRPGKPGRYQLIQVNEPDTLLAPGEWRPAVRIAEPSRTRTHNDTTVSTYVLTETTRGWLDDLPEDALILLHVDCDYFSNRYDGDSDWQTHLNIHDPPQAEVERSVDELCETLQPIISRVHDVTIALSPGFFPAEYWQQTVETLLQTVTIRRQAQTKTPVMPGTVRLERGTGSPGRGGGHGGQYWHVFEADRRAGRIWIDQADDTNLGPYASLTIELNQSSRGRGIGRLAYCLAVEASGYDEIWLHMRKSNIASRNAAEHAGFVKVDIPGQRQLTMRWRRSN
jgi:hypothetical protein